MCAKDVPVNGWAMRWQKKKTRLFEREPNPKRELVQDPYLTNITNVFEKKNSKFSRRNREDEQLQII